MADTASISKCLRDLQEFYGRKLPEGAILKWSQKLKFLDSRDLQVAVDDLISHERQFPTPDIVLKYADEARNHRAARERQRESISSGETPNKHNPSPSCLLIGFKSGLNHSELYSLLLITLLAFTID